MSFQRRLFLFALAYWLGAELSYALLGKTGNFSVFWPPAGIYLAMLLATPERRWWAVSLAAAFPNLLADVVIHHQPLPHSLGFLLINLAAPLLAAALLMRFCRPALSFARMSHVVTWLLVTTLVSTPLGALSGAVLVAPSKVGGFRQQWFQWWIGDLLGVLALTPLAYGLLGLRQWPLPRRMLEAATLLFSLGTSAVLLYRLPPSQALPPSILYLYLLWALRFEAMGVAASATLLTVIAVWQTGAGFGPYQFQQQPPARALMAQLMAATGALLFYILAAALAERQTAEQELQQSNVRLEKEVQKRTAELADAHAQLEFALKAGGLGYWRLTLPDFVLTCSERCRANFGIAPEKELTYGSILSMLHPADRARQKAAIKHALANKEDYAVEYRITTPQGAERWIDARGRAAFAANGAPLFMSGTTQDITERKEIELEREQILRREQHARALAEDANRAKDHWLAMVTHELRSPLNAILGHARLLDLRRAQLPRELSEFAEMVRRNGERQNELINDLLDTARAATGKLQLELGPVSLTGIIADAMDTVRPSALAKNISLLTDVDLRAGTLTGDAARLQQVAWNLLANAVKFTPPDGTVIIRLRRELERIVLSVCDSGCGIAPDFLPHVFERFSQADTSHSRRYGGLGLGLALVKQIVELHGGTITATSAGAGQGATFTVELPLHTTQPQDTETARQTAWRDSFPSPSMALASSLSLTGILLLVVDDEPDARAMTTALLGEHGALVTTVATAAEAWPLLTATERPRVLICDISLPDEDGYRLLTRLRQWEQENKTAALPALALTALSTFHDRMHALQAGFQMHVAKPVDPEELLLVLQSLLDRARMTGAAADA